MDREHRAIELLAEYVLLIEGYIRIGQQSEDYPKYHDTAFLLQLGIMKEKAKDIIHSA